MRSAVILAKEAGFVAAPPPAGREYTLSDRRTISEYFLQLYCSARRAHGNPDRTEFIWLDEFCLSDDNLPPDEDIVSAQRSTELSRLADIFRRAAHVVVFCHEENCDHTGLACIWGQRLFTIPEILHAQDVWQLTRRCEPNGMTAQLFPVPAHKFREKMKINAERGENWHLHAVLQHSDHGGAVAGDVVLHALVTEAIRRDEAGGFRDHEFLGKVLNGLLPRRARLADLGNGGWEDLAWLLELNQGSYDATILAAECSLADVGHEGVEWLGLPIAPRPGTERCTPLAIAFPVFSESGVPLAIHGQVVNFTTPQRDLNGLYTNNDMKGVRNLVWTIAVIFLTISALLWLSGQYTASKIIYIVTAMLYRIVELLAGTIYLVRSGWVFLEDAQWGRLGNLDPTLHNLDSWGDPQCSPQWRPSGRRPYFTAKLVDLRRRVYVDVIVVSRPTSMVLVASHGSGVTAILTSPHADPNQRRIGAARKAGMCHLPMYIREEAVESDPIYIGTLTSSDSP
ncbi:hypothetical protein B0H16DRAFT_1418338 [Mycena metata]|uniref:Heterokaryon incompatibility domain-containing protein n=1 Tax=Mycena metata TaxID=1033252 RepID=A0AAD7J2F8_9AGAR|nr:hypothetical protein B0H16DRAFT_1418338 [Mycena metata]